MNYYRANGTQAPQPNYILYIAGNNMIVHAVKKENAIYLFTVSNLLNNESSRFVIKNNKLYEILSKDMKTVFEADRYRLEKWSCPTFNYTNNKEET
jgi:hypothetical protein